MGLFDFVADAGEKLTEKVLGSTANEEATRTVEVSPQRVNELRQQNIAHMVAQLDVEGEKVAVKVEGDTEVLTDTTDAWEPSAVVVFTSPAA